MPTPDRDRFDDVPRTHGRVGAHRAENPGMNGWVVLLWSIVAALVLIVAGVFGAMVVMGKISFGPEPTVSVAPSSPETSAPTLDTSYAVLVLNATTVDNLAATVRDSIVTAGFPETAVIASNADATDFPQTTVYFQNPEDQAAAEALAGLIGGAQVLQSDVYADDVVEGQKQLTVVIGLDRVPADAPAEEQPPADEQPPAEDASADTTAEGTADSTADATAEAEADASGDATAE
ncbi:LytR C-terminal domain-containing protein [Microbacterium resistens]